MNLSRIQRAAVSGLILSTIALTGCGSGGGGSTTIPATSGTALSGGTTNPTIAFGSFVTGPLAVKEARSITPSESGYTGTFTASTTNANIVSVAPGSTAGTFVVTGVAVGTATVSFSDTASHTGAVALTVSAIGFGTLSVAPLAITESRTFSPSEPGYTGSFSFTSSNPNVISVTPASGAGPFEMTAVSAGTATLTLSDSLGHVASVTLTVAPAGTLATPVPGTTPTPVATVAPTANPAPGSSATPAPGSSATPAPGSSATPAPGSSATPAPGSSATPAPGSSPTVAPSPTASPVSTPTPYPIAVSPLSINLGAGNLGTVNVSLPGGASQSSVSATALDNSIALATNLGGGVWQIVANLPGTTSINFSDGAGHTATLAVDTTGTASPIHLASSNGFSLTLLGINVTTVTPSESGYAGSYTVTSSNTGVMIVAPIPLTNNVLVTSVGAGNAILNVSDTLGHVAHIGLNVH